jgi:hypothetical protein
MREKYVVYMKNGSMINIKGDKYRALSEILTRERPPLFVNIDGNVINVSAISHCAIEDDKTW